MGFRKDGYCTVWETKPGKGNYTDVRISCSKKDKKTGNYETDFSGYVRFIGTAHQNAGSLKPKDRIKIGDCEVTNTYSKEKNTTYTNYAVYSFEMASGNGSNSNQNNSNKFMEIPDGMNGEELPFN